MKFPALILSVAILSGCAGTTTPQQGVYSAKTQYAAALTIAVSYKRLPVCSATVKLPCSDPKIVAQLQKADNVAAASLDAAENAVRTPGFGKDVAQSALAAANAALAAFVSITSTLQVK